MSTTLDRPRHEQASAPQLRLQPARRRRPALVAASGALVALCVAVFTGLYAKAGHQVAVLVVAHDVPLGATIGADDVTEARISLSPAMSSIPATAVSSVVGHRAAVALVPGALVVPGDLTSRSAPPPGSAVVGVALEIRSTTCERRHPRRPGRRGAHRLVRLPDRRRRRDGIRDRINRRRRRLGVRRGIGHRPAGAGAQRVAAGRVFRIGRHRGVAARSIESRSPRVECVHRGASGTRRRAPRLMTSVALCSAKGSPGVTTLATALGAVWPATRSVVLAECDPSGGDLAARFGLSLRRGTTSLVLAHRHAGNLHEDLTRHIQQLPGGLAVLAGPVGADAATALDRELVNVPSAVLQAADDVILDCGRLLTSAPGQRTLVEQADLVLLVTKLDVASIGHARAAADRLSALREQHGVALITCGEPSDRAAEAAQVVDLPLYDVLPADPAGASLVGGSAGTDRNLRRSKLISAANRLAHRMVPTDESDHPAVPVGSEQSIARTDPRRDPVGAVKRLLSVDRTDRTRPAPRSAS